MHFFQLTKQNTICWKFQNNSFFQKHKHDILQNYVSLKSSSGFLFFYINKKHQDRFLRHSCKHQSIPNSQGKNQVPHVHVLDQPQPNCHLNLNSNVMPRTLSDRERRSSQIWPSSVFQLGTINFLNVFPCKCCPSCTSRPVTVQCCLWCCLTVCMKPVSLCCTLTRGHTEYLIRVSGFAAF